RSRGNPVSVGPAGRPPYIQPSSCHAAVAQRRGNPRRSPLDVPSLTRPLERHDRPLKVMPDEVIGHSQLRGRTGTRFSFVPALGRLAECQRSPTKNPRSTDGSPPMRPATRIWSAVGAPSVAPTSSRRARTTAPIRPTTATPLTPLRYRAAESCGATRKPATHHRRPIPPRTLLSRSPSLRWNWPTRG